MFKPAKILTREELEAEAKLAVWKGELEFRLGALEADLNYKTECASRRSTFLAWTEREAYDRRLTALERRIEELENK